MGRHLWPLSTTSVAAMRAILFALFLGAAASFVEQNEWAAYKQKHGKVYSNIMEEFYRMKVYSDNKVFVEKHNAEHAEGKHTYTVALNKFADLTTEEWSATYKGLVRRRSMPHEVHQIVEEAPETMDWRDQGVVSAIKDQGQCGSCWAFSATGSLESAWVLAGNSMVTLSEQQLVDCSTFYGNHGCDGGNIDLAFDYIKANDGIESESSYPYTARDGTCRDYASATASIKSYVDVSAFSEKSLQNAVGTKGPVSIGIDASHQSFQLYSDGIYNEPSCSEFRLDHGVLAVGYGDGYWLVKNSWGTGWGMSGYIKMTRDGSNQCGVATEASYPRV